MKKYRKSPEIINGPEYTVSNTRLVFIVLRTLSYLYRIPSERSPKQHLNKALGMQELFNTQVG